MELGALVHYGMLNLARISPLFLMPSLLPLAKLPSTVKVIFAVALSMIMMMAIPVPNDLQQLSVMQLIVGMGQEVIIGMGLLFGVQVTFGAILFAGKLVDLQLGFGVASVLDPMTQSQEALIGSLLNVLFTVAFFILDMHHLLLSGFAAMFTSFPVGSGILLPSQSHLVSFFSSQFILGLLVVMPVVLGLFLLDVVIAFTSRTMPQVNVYFVSLPLKIFLGLLILSISLKHMSGLIENMFLYSIRDWIEGFKGY
ncbi:MAG: flagellar biosynthetic protein FliR [Kangiellaceae bacterium]|nr:flagellar biosynthetic protein FliR [Kangiellaceae bacterium]MCW8997875.1 flagellar biosynthetic protein FliR [Kangiellaceae bacterium]MCW9017573.1 flagellar biosynthetic protein FliR [Kangiellaceae bacterium]